MYAKVLTSFGTADGLNFEQGQVSFVPDDIAPDLLDAMVIQQVRSPIEEMVEVAKEHNVLLQLTAETSKDFAKALRQAGHDVGARVVMEVKPAAKPKK